MVPKRAVQTLAGNDPAIVARVRDLHVTFPRRGASIHALRGVSLDIGRGEILGLVGESGSGKTVLGRALLGLLPAAPGCRTEGSVHVEGVDMVGGASRVRRDVRRDSLGAIFQDPMMSLNPTMRIGRQMGEVSGSAAESIRLLEAAGIPNAANRLESFPHQLSGGLRQRVMIAMSIAGQPSLVVADEPTTALDVTVQAQVLNLLRGLCDALELSIVFVTHDLAVAAEVADRIAVLYGGRIAELGPADDVFGKPVHPYSRGLAASPACR